MNTIDTLPKYGDYAMAGATDAFFKWLIGWEMPYFADGNVEAPTGYFTVVSPDSMDVAQYINESGDVRLSGSRLIRPGVYYLTRENSDGIIYVEAYDGLDGGRSREQQRRRCLADFSMLTRAYTEWAELEYGDSDA